MQETKYRIGWKGAAILIFFATIADILSLIPIVGAMTGPIFWAGATIYLWKAGCGLANPRRLATTAISFLGEIMPAVQMLPLTLTGIIVILVMVRREDKIGMKKAPSDQNRREPPPRQVPNQNGRRLSDKEMASV